MEWNKETQARLFKDGVKLLAPPLTGDLVTLAYDPKKFVRHLWIGYQVEDIFMDGRLDNIGRNIQLLQKQKQGFQTSQVTSSGGRSNPDSVNANCYATSVNSQNTSGGSSGANKGPSEVNPLKGYYYDKADAARQRATRYKAMARQFYGSYEQAAASHKELMASFSNSDYFSYWLLAAQAKQMADQAYAQYSDYSRRASRAQDQARKYDRLGDNIK